MKFQFWSVGKAHEAYIKEGVELFTKRISYYYGAEWQIIAPPKNAAALNGIDLKKKEGETILGLLQKDDFLVLLDERGKNISSEQLAALIETQAGNSTKKMVFLIGGAYGVSNEVMQRASFKWSLSLLVFPHQLVRLILAEQVYRACTIIKNEKYHHQ